MMIGCLIIFALAMQIGKTILLAWEEAGNATSEDVEAPQQVYHENQVQCNYVPQR